VILAVPGGSATRPAAARQARVHQRVAGDGQRLPRQRGPARSQRCGNDQGVGAGGLQRVLHLCRREEQRQRHVHDAGASAASSSATKAAELSRQVASTCAPASRKPADAPATASASATALQVRRPSSSAGLTGLSSGGAPVVSCRQPAPREHLQRRLDAAGQHQRAVIVVAAPARRLGAEHAGSATPSASARCPGARTGAAVPRSAC